MKTIVKGMLILVLFLFAGCAGSSSYMMKATPVDAPPPGKALVYFMRPSGMGFAINFQIWDGDRFVGLSQAKSYFAHPCEPGEHLFMGFAENKVAVEADLEAGKRYYIGTGVRMGVWKARMAFNPVTRGSELWDKVEEYESTLNFIAPNPAEVKRWEDEKREEARKWIAHFRSPEGRDKVQTLSREDGR